MGEDSGEERRSLDGVRTPNQGRGEEEFSAMPDTPPNENFFHMFKKGYFFEFPAPSPLCLPLSFFSPSFFLLDHRISPSSIPGSGKSPSSLSATPEMFGQGLSQPSGVKEKDYERLRLMLHVLLVGFPGFPPFFPFYSMSIMITFSFFFFRIKNAN